MNTTNEILSMSGINTTKEQAIIENELFPLINFQYQIKHKKQHIIQINQESSYRQFLAIVRGDMIINSGRMRLNQKELMHLPPMKRYQILHERIGFIDFEEGLIPYLTILENSYAAFWNIPKNIQRFQTTIQALFHWFTLENVQDCFPKACSPAQRIDVQFIRAFVHQPELVIATIPLDVPLYSIVRLQKLAEITGTALCVFMQMDPVNEREPLFNAKMIRGTIMERIECSNEYTG